MNDENKQDLTSYAKDELGATEIMDRDDIIGSAMTDSSTIPADVQSEFDKAPTTTDILGTGKIDFHKDLPQCKFDDLVDHTFLIREIKMIEGWDGFYGTSNFGLLLGQLRDGRKFTTLAGGIAVVKQLRNFINKRRFPVKVTLTQQPGAQGPYYLFA